MTHRRERRVLGSAGLTEPERRGLGSAGSAEPERLARAALSWLAEPGDAQLSALLRTCSPGAIVTALTHGTWPPGDVGARPPGDDGARPPGDDGAWPPGGAPGPAIPGLKTALNRWTARLGDLPTQRTLDGWARAGIRLLCPGDPGWPSQLAVLGDSSPWALWVRGSADLRFACLRSVSIVGTRAATGYGCHVCAELAAALAERGWAVVSGGAFGIDGWAHRARSAPRESRSRCCPPGWMTRIRAATTSCSRPSPHTACWSANGRRAGLRPGRGSWCATG